MPRSAGRRARVAGTVALLLLVTLGTVGVILWHVVPDPHDEPVSFAGLQSSRPVPVVAPPRTSARIVLELPPLFDWPNLPSQPGAHVGVRVATYLQEPSATLVLRPRAADGTVLRTCTIPPSDYTDNGLALCPVDSVGAARTIEVEVRGARGKLALYRSPTLDDVGGGVWGPLPPTSLGDRLRAAAYRLSTRRPAGVGVLTLTVALVGTVGLLASFLVVLARVPADRREPPRQRLGAHGSTPQTPE